MESAALATPAHGSYDPTFAKDGRMDGLEGRPWMADVDPHSDSGFRLERLANGWRVGRFAALEAIGVAEVVEMIKTWWEPRYQGLEARDQELEKVKTDL